MDDFTGFEITYLLEVSIAKLKSFTSLSLISLLKVVSDELEAWKLKIGGSTVDAGSSGAVVGVWAGAVLPN